MLDYLITGGAGFIGMNLRSFLQSEGKSFEVVDINSCRDDYLWTDCTVRLPPTEAKTLVHLASETNVRRSIDYPCLTIERNIAGILRCLTALKDGQFKSLVFTSSASSARSTSPYLASKLSCEAICKSFKSSYKLNISVLKLSNVYGPNSMHKSSVIHSFIKNCLDHRALTIFGDGSQSRDFVHVSDVVRAIVNEEDGIVSSGILTPVRQLAYMISDLSNELTGFRPKIEYKSSIRGEVKKPSPSFSPLPKVNIVDGLQSTFVWYLENYESKRLEQIRSS